MLGHCAKQAQVVGVRTRANAELALVLGVSQLLIRVHVGFLDLDLVVNDDAGAGGQAKPRNAAIGCGGAAQVGGNGVVQHLGLDGLEQTVHFTLVEPGRIHQQDDVCRRCRAFSLQSSEDACIVGVHAVDLDTRGLGEPRVERLVGGVVAGGVQIHDLLLGQCGARSGGQCAGGQQGFHGLRHGNASFGVAML